MAIEVVKKDCINIAKALGLEWLDTNGTGGYASSTVLGCNTRRYHGLLVARLEQPPGKFVLLSKLDDSLAVGDHEHHLSVHQYPGVIFPRGHRYLTRFTLGRVPSFTYTVGGTRVVKEVALLEGRNAVLVRYHAARNRSGALLRVRPLLAYRDFHALTRENIDLRVRTFPARDGFSIAPYEGMPPLYMRVSGRFELFRGPTWYRDFEYFVEQRRGFDFREDLFCPGLIEIELLQGDSVILAASTEEITDDLEELWQAELERRRRFHRRLRGTDFQKTLMTAARQFLTTDARGRTAITAGYHWFQEWGRDALIALPGLTLYNGQRGVYLEVLATFAAHERDGLIPNFIGASDDRNAYNSADASLWFAYATQKYLESTRDADGVRRVAWPTLARVFAAYRDGTRHGIRMLESGLLTAGSATEQLTWMDAVVDGAPVTPRNGCAVELNALWYNLVRFVEELGRRFGEPIADEAAALAPRIAQAFVETFWIEERGHLADVWRDGTVDPALRPNQILAVSLPYSALDEERALALLGAVSRELLSTLGLRTLSPRAAHYAGRYEGGPAARDRAYHNGTVWPWLIGHYGEALLHYSADKEWAIGVLERVLEAFEPHLREAGLGTVSEVFDGDPPQTPGGCISQAWSVAELLRLTKLIEAYR